MLMLDLHTGTICYCCRWPQRFSCERGGGAVSRGWRGRSLASERRQEPPRSLAGGTATPLPQAGPTLSLTPHTLPHPFPQIGHTSSPPPPPGNLVTPPAQPDHLRSATERAGCGITQYFWSNQKVMMFYSILDRQQVDRQHEVDRWLDWYLFYYYHYL